MDYIAAIQVKDANERLLPNAEYRDDPDEYEEEEEAENEEENDEDEKNEWKIDILVNGRNEIELIVIIFQIPAVTLMSLVVTSDNPQASDEDLWLGYNFSFALIICFALMIIITYIYKFAANKKREARFLDKYKYFFGLTIIIPAFNILIILITLDYSPW